MEMNRKAVLGKGTEEYIGRIDGYAELVMTKETLDKKERSDIKKTFKEFKLLLQDLKDGKYLKPPTDFCITEEQLNKVTLPDQSIGVNTFSKCINEVIDLHVSKKLTGMELNQKLKNEGILSEKLLDGNRRRTVTNERSLEYGFYSETRERDGNSYEMVLINEKGKAFLLKEINRIMNQ